MFVMTWYSLLSNFLAARLRFCSRPFSAFTSCMIPVTNLTISLAHWPSPNYPASTIAEPHSGTAAPDGGPDQLRRLRPQVGSFGGGWRGHWRGSREGCRSGGRPAQLYTHNKQQYQKRELHLTAQTKTDDYRPIALINPIMFVCSRARPCELAHLFHCCSFTLAKIQHKMES